MSFSPDWFRLPNLFTPPHPKRLALRIQVDSLEGPAEMQNAREVFPPGALRLAGNMSTEAVAVKRHCGSWLPASMGSWAASHG